jgi:hypothetical protein
MQRVVGESDDIFEWEWECGGQESGMYWLVVCVVGVSPVFFSRFFMLMGIGLRIKIFLYVLLRNIE